MLSSAETLGGAVRSEVQARKFYSQRNMYLCGFTLFLSLILNRTYVLILDTLRLEDEVKRLSGGSAGSKTGDSSEISRLKKELESARKDVATIKKQAESWQQEYNRLSDEKSATDTSPKKDR